MQLTSILFWILTILACLAMISILLGLVNRKSGLRRNARQKKVLRIAAGLFGVVAIALLVFNVILPLAGVSGLKIYGLMILAAAIIIYYCVALYYRTLVLNFWVQKAISYVVLMSEVAVLYMVVFYVVYTFLFKIKDPPTEVFVLNFVMIVIVLLLFPVIWELFAFMRSVGSSQTVDLTYVVKKMSRFATTNVKPSELADFLADYMHFNYIGIFLDGKLYGSREKEISTEELTKISRLAAAEKGVWQEIATSSAAAEVCEKFKILAVAQLKNAKGSAYGQILVGCPTGKKTLDRKDLAQMEMIVNLVSAVLDSESRTGAKRKAWRRA